jgi:hypothetical protein
MIYAGRQFPAVGTENSVCVVITWKMDELVGPAYLKLNCVADQLAD